MWLGRWGLTQIRSPKLKSEHNPQHCRLLPLNRHPRHLCLDSWIFFLLMGESCIWLDRLRGGFHRFNQNILANLPGIYSSIIYEEEKNFFSWWYLLVTLITHFCPSLLLFLIKQVSSPSLCNFLTKYIHDKTTKFSQN